MSVRLVQTIEFIATRKSKFDGRVIAHIMFPDIVKERSFQDWNNIILPIPAICSTSNEESNIIKINYFVVFNFDTSGIAVSKDLLIPITIGTIPFKDNLNSGSSALTQNSFEGCMFGPNTDFTNEDENKGEYYGNDSNTYMPLYPVYHDFSLSNS